MPPLKWKPVALGYEEAIIGDFEHGDGARFSLEFRATCYRRGPWRLLVEIAKGPQHHTWGCFDDADQPERNYHHEDCARREAQAIAAVLLKDREARGRLPEHTRTAEIVIGVISERSGPLQAETLKSRP
jgi:hypothetical protein